MQYATTLGQDGNPQSRPIEFKFEEDGVLYFDTVKLYTSYAELLDQPYIQLCIGDQETMTYVCIGGKVNFTEDKDIINRYFEASPVLTSQFGDNRDIVIGYYLTDVWAELARFQRNIQTKNIHWKTNMMSKISAKEVKQYGRQRSNELHYAPSFHSAF